MHRAVGGRCRERAGVAESGRRAALSVAEQRAGARRARETDAADARLAAARANLYPSIDLSSSTTRTRIEGGGAIADTTQRQNGFGLEWLLLDNGQRELRIRQSSRTADATRQSTRETLRRVLFPDRARLLRSAAA
jgi:outer membrane protein TolC